MPSALHLTSSSCTTLQRWYVRVCQQYGAEVFEAGIKIWLLLNRYVINWWDLKLNPIRRLHLCNFASRKHEFVLQYVKR
jgi:hypothetical protein